MKLIGWPCEGVDFSVNLQLLSLKLSKSFLDFLKGFIDIYLQLFPLSISALLLTFIWLTLLIFCLVIFLFSLVSLLIVLLPCFLVVVLKSSELIVLCKLWFASLVFALFLSHLLDEESPLHVHESSGDFYAVVNQRSQVKSAVFKKTFNQGLLGIVHLFCQSALFVIVFATLVAQFLLFEVFPLLLSLFVSPPALSVQLSGLALEPPIVIKSFFEVGSTFLEQSLAYLYHYGQQVDQLRIKWVNLPPLLSQEVVKEQQLQNVLHTVVAGKVLFSFSQHHKLWNYLSSEHHHQLV